MIQFLSNVKRKNVYFIKKIENCKILIKFSVICNRLHAKVNDLTTDT